MIFSVQRTNMGYEPFVLTELSKTDIPQLLTKAYK